MGQSQLKMYWFASEPVERMTLPEGYSFSHFSEKNRDIDIPDWNECIRTWPTPGDGDAERFDSEIYGFKDIVPERDVWFLDHDGEHVGTCTGFIWGCGGAWQADGEHCVGDLHWVGIKTSHRGLGLSKYLSNIIQVTLKERGVRYVSLTTGEGRPAAVKSYLTAGFLPVEYAEGMTERWEKVLEKYGIDHVQMLREDASPYKVIYRSGKSL